MTEMVGVWGGGRDQSSCLQGLGGGQEEVWDGKPGEQAGLEGIKVLLIAVQS